MDQIQKAIEKAVSSGLDTACRQNKITPPVSITRAFWAQGLVREFLRLGRMPTQKDLNELVGGMPPLFVSDDK